MIKLLTTREVSEKIGRSLRRTQEIVGKSIPHVEIWENGQKRFGVREEVLSEFLRGEPFRSLAKR